MNKEEFIKYARQSILWAQMRALSLGISPTVVDLWMRDAKIQQVV